MGQFLNYLSSVFTVGSKDKLEGSPVKGTKQTSQNHVTFADNSFTQAFANLNKSDAAEKAAKLEATTKSNVYTINFYTVLCIAIFVAQIYKVVLPKLYSNSFDIWQPQDWQFLGFNLVPNFMHVSCIAAMVKIHKPLTEGAKLSSKNSDLDFKQNEFVKSLKKLVMLIVVAQIVSIVYNELIWSSMLIIPFWAYLLTAKLAHSEYKRFAPSPKKQLFKLNKVKSPKLGSPAPAKQAQASPSKHERDSNGQVPATPRTRTKRAVTKMLGSVSDKYHQIEQNVAHQISQRFMPLTPKAKAISDKSE